MASATSSPPVVAFAAAAVAAAGPGRCRRAVGRSVLVRSAAGCWLPRRSPSRRCRPGVWAAPVAAAGGAAAPRPGEGEGEGDKADGGGDAGDTGGTADADAGAGSASPDADAGSASPDADAAAAASADDSDGTTSVPLELAKPADGANREGPVAIEYLREGVNDEEAGSGDDGLIRLPLFPLSMVLHPGTEAVPLHIFEMKFRVRLRGQRGGRATRGVRGGGECSVG